MKESIEQWLVRHDLYLWGEGMTPGKAIALAKADGHDVKMRAFVRLARQECHWWRAEPLARLGRRGCLTEKEWTRLNRWVRDHRDLFPAFGSLKTAARLLRRMGLVGSPDALVESMRSAGVAHPQFPPKGLNCSVEGKVIL